MKIRSFTSAVLMLVALCLPSLLHAQGDPGLDPDPIPLDGGLSMLIAAGVAYGAKKAYDKRKGEKNAGASDEKPVE